LQIDSLKAIVFTAAFLMPGFIWSAVLSLLVPRRSRESETRFLEFFTLSCINNAPWFWLFIYFDITGFSARKPGLFALFLFIALFIAPLSFGIIAGHLAQREYVGRFLQRFGFRTIHSTPTAWDWHFSQQEPLWARIRLQDGSVIYGFFGPKSFASSDPDERDIYLEQVLAPSPDGFKCVEDTGGCLVKGTQIGAIEFYKVVALKKG
jgi:hypothetical protein